MGLFSTSVNFNQEKVQAVIENINTTKGKLSDIEETLRGAINTIVGASGYAELEAEGVSLATDIAATVVAGCYEGIDGIVSAINEKEELIAAYNNAEGFDKVKMFFSIKADNIKNDMETGGTILDGCKSVLGSIAGVITATGAAIFEGGSKLIEMIGDGVVSAKEFLFGKPREKSDNIFDSSNKDSSGKSEENIFGSNKSNTITSSNTWLTNVETANRSINVSNLSANSRVKRAIDKYADEIANADYVTITDKLFTTTMTDYVNGQPVQVTHVVINDPSQIGGSPANGAYGSGLETSSNAARRLNSKILINGSHFNYSDGSEDLKGANNISIVNGQIKRDGYSGGNELLVDSSGRIFNAYGKSAQELVDAGVKYSYSCHSTQVIENGDISPSYREGNSYKRNVIGMTEPCEYYIITDQTYNNRLPDTATYLKNKGCTNAYSLDQGGSVTLVRNDDVINTTTDGERAIGDFLYFT